MDPTRWIRESIADPDGSRAKCHAKDPLCSVYLAKSSEKITRTALCAAYICREVGEPIKDFKASRASDPGEVV